MFLALLILVIHGRNFERILRLLLDLGLLRSFRCLFGFGDLSLKLSDCLLCLLLGLALFRKFKGCFLLGFPLALEGPLSQAN